MNDPVRKPVVHHRGEIRKFDAIAVVQVNPAGGSVKREIENAVVPLAKQIEVVLKLFTRVAR